MEPIDEPQGADVNEQAKPAAPQPKCSRCRDTGTIFYRSGPDDVSHDICDCVLEANAFLIVSGGPACR